MKPTDQAPNSGQDGSAANRLFVVDGSALLFRSHFAFLRRPLTTSRGEHVGALFGFLTTLLALIREEEATHVAVVFDPAGPTLRHKIFPEYKANRPETPPELSAQFPMAHRLLESMGMKPLVQDGVEADDLIGSLAESATARGWEAIIVSSDKDFAQLIGGGIRQFIPPRGREPAQWMEAEEVAGRWGVRPEQFIDYLALTGDSSDNIPGVKGVGPKTASRLLQDFESLRALYERLDEVKPEGLRTKLATGRAAADLSRDLVRIRTDLEVAGAEAFAVGDPATRSTFRAFLQEMEFHGLIRRIFDEAEGEPAGQAQLAFAAAAPAAKGGDRDPTQVAGDWNQGYRLIESPEALRSALRDYPHRGDEVPPLSIDTETDSTAPLSARLVGLSFGWEPGRAWYVPIGHDEGPRVALGEVQSALGPILADRSITKLGQNLKFDLHILRRHGLEVRGPLWDTMVASYVRDPEARHSLDGLAQEFLGHEMIPISALIGRGRNQTTMNTIAPATAAAYACEDADAVLRLWPVLDRRVADVGARELFTDLEMPLLPVLLDMEAAGIYLDGAMLEAMSHEFAGEMVRLEREIHRLGEEEFNINSPKQLQVILFEKLKLPVKRRTKTGYSTGQEVLEELAGLHPLPAKILEYRQLTKLQSTYVEALPKMVSDQTGRIHASFHQTVTATGRLSSSNPNLQNIPIRTPMGRRIRRAFAAQGERCLLSADYSQIELRLLAHLSGDPHLVEAFRKGADIHRATAARIFGRPEEEVDRDMRDRAKTINFGILYGMGAQRLAREQGITVKEASAFIASYFEKLPGVKAYVEGCIGTARSRGYAETILGRRRYLPKLQSKHHGDRSSAERMAVNTPVQGSAADLIKRAMVSLHARLKREEPDVQLLLQVHDELVFELPSAKAEAVAELVSEEMASVLELAVPLTVDEGWGRTWYDAHS